MQTKPNIHERSARFAKRIALRRAMDRAIREAGADPSTDPHAVADALARWPLSDWARFAVAFGIRPPSATTVGELLDDYRRDGGSEAGDRDHGRRAPGRARCGVTIAEIDAKLAALRPGEARAVRVDLTTYGDGSAVINEELAAPEVSP